MAAVFLVLSGGVANAMATVTGVVSRNCSLRAGENSGRSRPPEPRRAARVRRADGREPEFDLDRACRYADGQ